MLPHIPNSLAEWRESRDVQRERVALTPAKTDELLREAVMARDAQSVRALLQEGPEWAAWQDTARKRRHPAGAAIINRDLECVKAFVELTGAAQWSMDSDSTMLSLAVEADFSDAFPVLLARGAHPARCGLLSFSPLWLAAQADQNAWRISDRAGRSTIEAEGLFARLARAIDNELERRGLPDEDRASRAAWWAENHEPPSMPVRGAFASLAIAAGGQCGRKVDADISQNPKLMKMAHVMRGDATGADWLTLCARKLVALGADVNAPSGSLSLIFSAYGSSQSEPTQPHGISVPVEAPHALARLLGEWIEMGARWEALGEPPSPSGESLIGCNEGNRFNNKRLPRRVATSAAAESLNATAMAAIEAVGHKWSKRERVRAAAVAWCSVAQAMSEHGPDSAGLRGAKVGEMVRVAQKIAEKSNFWPNWAPKGPVEDWWLSEPKEWDADRCRAMRENVALMESMALDQLRPGGAAAEAEKRAKTVDKKPEGAGAPAASKRSRRL